ncbi:hypothetical protein GGS20DRAFT_562421 [Poronia punctata]|nr:hypothetical protein GGS20DRAFT_562421 [Poronia punctata]
MSTQKQQQPPPFEGKIITEAFQNAIEELSIKQEQTNEEHRVAMIEADKRLSTLDQEHAQAMAEADVRLDNLGPPRR